MAERRPMTSATSVSFLPGSDMCCFCGHQVSAEKGHTPAFFGPQANMLCHRDCREAHEADLTAKQSAKPLAPVPADNEVTATITLDIPEVEPYRRALRDIAVILRGLDL